MGFSHRQLTIGGVFISKVIISIMLLAIAVSVIIGSVVPCTEQIQNTGVKTFEIVKSLNDNIK